MQMTFTAKFLLMFFGGIILFVTPGCAVDNEHFAKLPLFEAKSDKIPGLQPPYERKKEIRLKGEKGTTIPDAEKEILVAQLMVEYRTSPDPNMRREAVDALAKIPHPKRDQYMKEILKDDDPFVRLSALEGIGNTFSGSNAELTSIFIEHSKQDSDKDVRLASVRILGSSCSVEKKKEKKKNSSEPLSPELRNTIIFALGEALYDKVPAIRYESMQSLRQVTGKDYGNDINRWTQYVQYTKGANSEQPKERTFAEKLPSIQLPMFK
jgi:hypothetical protein